MERMKCEGREPSASNQNAADPNSRDGREPEFRNRRSDQLRRNLKVEVEAFFFLGGRTQHLASRKAIINKASALMMEAKVVLQCYDLQQKQGGQTGPSLDDCWFCDYLKHERRRVRAQLKFREETVERKKKVSMISC